MFKPISVSIIGLGDFGGGFAKILKNKPFIDKIKIYSETILKEEGYEKRKQAFELTEKNYIFCNSLEECLEYTDCALICTSKGPKLAKKADRSDFLKYVGRLIMDYGERFSMIGYEGLVLIFTNPVGPCLYLFKEKSVNKLDVDQISSPFGVNPKRMIQNLLNIVDYDKQKYEKLESFISKYAYGVHGMPDILVPDNPDLSIEELSILMRAKKGIWLFVHEKLSYAHQHDIPVTECQESGAKFLERLAKYEKNLGSAYCFYDECGVPIALPFILGDYKNGMRISYDKNEQEIVEKSRDRVNFLLKSQMNSVNEFYSKLKK